MYEEINAHELLDVAPPTDREIMGDGEEKQTYINVEDEDKRTYVNVEEKGYQELGPSPPTGSSVYTDLQMVL